MREEWTHTAALTHRDVEVQDLHEEHKASEQQWIHLLVELMCVLLLQIWTGQPNSDKRRSKRFENSKHHGG